MLLVIKATTRRWGLLIFAASLGFSLATFGIGSCSTRTSRRITYATDVTIMHAYYLEGTLAREPEKLPNRSRWLLRCERIWHPTGAEEISGNFW
jgi:hypothetical protein